MAEFMSNSDAFTWAMEADPRLRSTIVSLLILDERPDWDAVTHRFDRLSRVLPVFRQRVVASPVLAPPRWEYDPDFDLDYHVRRIAAPPPADTDALLELCRVAAMESFDTARPLWHVTLVDGLADGRAAMISKVHHALTDGIGGIQIGMTLFDLQPEAPTPELPDPPGGAVADRWDEYRAALRYGAGLLGSAVTGALTAAPRLFYDGLRDPRGAVVEVAETAASVYRTVRPISRTGSPLMKERTLIRDLSTYSVPMAQLRAVANARGAALNDAFLAGVTGGLRRYHEQHGSQIDELHLTMPISLRTEADAMGGNHITLMRFDVPAGEPDPATRIERIHRRVRRVRSEKSLPYTQLIAGALNLVPREVLGSVLTRVDFLASDVPGIPVPVFLGGARVVEQYAFGPTIGAAVNVTLLTYVDTCAFGIDIDVGAIPDPAVFHRCLVEGFAEVLALAD
ncbi:MAG TPA: wax ester/triacylglycerol synthase family O-acyltransferase [Mycolicibacterium fallax]|nr:wax ester/triacylglycerol synthase family O-acyltransferase [Mycolicibacterium fallax]HSA40707.1 wax ester/triacylglycerol synthase family O-acyltransferase [Mycobacterium sp.]